MKYCLCCSIRTSNNNILILLLFAGARDATEDWSSSPLPNTSYGAGLNENIDENNAVLSDASDAVPRDLLSSSAESIEGDSVKNVDNTNAKECDSDKKEKKFFGKGGKKKPRGFRPSTNDSAQPTRRPMRKSFRPRSNKYQRDGEDKNSETKGTGKSEEAPGSGPSHTARVKKGPAYKKPWNIADRAGGGNETRNGGNYAKYKKRKRAVPKEAPQ